MEMIVLVLIVSAVNVCKKHTGVFLLLFLQSLPGYRAISTVVYWAIFSAGQR